MCPRGRIETIASIRQRVPDSFVVLVDDSDLSQFTVAASHDENRFAGEARNTWARHLRGLVDLFVNEDGHAPLRHFVNPAQASRPCRAAAVQMACRAAIFRHHPSPHPPPAPSLATPPQLRHATDESPAKHLGECMMLDIGLRALKQEQVMYRAVFKLTARYVLNDKFDFSVFDHSHSVFKRATRGPAANQPFYAYTSFYKISEPNVRQYHGELKRTIKARTHPPPSHTPCTTTPHPSQRPRLVE